jgi:hypothetical protein
MIPIPNHMILTCPSSATLRIGIFEYTQAIPNPFLKFSPYSASATTVPIPVSEASVTNLNTQNL